VARWHFVFSGWSGTGRTFSLRDDNRQAPEVFLGGPPKIQKLFLQQIGLLRHSSLPQEEERTAAQGPPSA
jgi:hypothetical protein